MLAVKPQPLQQQERKEVPPRLSVFGPRATRSSVASACARQFTPALFRLVSTNASPTGSSGRSSSVFLSSNTSSRGSNSPKWSREQVAEVVRLVLCASTNSPSSFEYDEKTWLSKAPFGFDHLDLLHIASTLEKTFYVQLQADVSQLQTPFDITDAICFRLGIPRF